MTLYIGLMSGTSMDGIDAAVVDVDTQQLIKGITRPYSAETKTALNNLLNNKQHDLSSIYQLNTLIGRDFGQITKELLIEAYLTKNEITAIGSHGQTIAHDAEASIPYTVQLGCGHTIAEMTKIAVVADFRTRDLVLGGHGAPLAPLYHQQLFTQFGYPLTVVNIGGIANITNLISSEHVNGYDLGPGNCLMDAWILRHQGTAYDAEGHWASQGVVLPSLLESLLADPFIQKKFPKSIGKEYFSMDWLQQHLEGCSYAAIDVQATLLSFTAHVIMNAITHDQRSVKHLMLCGGGAHNTHLLNVLRELMPGMTVSSSHAVGISPDFIEAQMMAWLAHQQLTNQPVDLKMITGSSRKTILGVFYPAGIDK